MNVKYILDQVIQINRVFESLLKKFNLTFFKPDNISKYIAERISKGHLIGWFQDRMEFTHRALGNRSILADPRKIEMQLKVNFD